MLTRISSLRIVLERLRGRIIPGRPSRAGTVAFSSILLAALLPSAGAAAADTLAKIAATGTIVIGHRQNELPFSYVVDDNVVGYSTDICLRIVEGIQRELRLDSIEIVYMPATTATRFILIGNGSVDMECAATTNNAERRQLAEFSYPHFVTATRFVSKKKDGMDTIADLAGRSVVSTTGTVNIEQLNELNRTRNLNISVILSRGHKEAFEMVAAGSASAFVMDDILLAGLVASSPTPSDFTISSETLSRPEPYGILMPPGDLAFKDLVNREMRRIFESGEINAIYEKWFMQPVPPTGQNLNLPMSADLKAAFANPQEYED
ncbi:amino acid ABC transporter substrate-binding protein [Rhizobiaceae bacterium BDR2-2]|uniref:Amino acid ABC transporter substrate-binding protein n=1 Tax=Ectorhizobium quercum TaxID=2965071 RepID=A0AAE3MZH8_9HYPH|nr:amino acid ABC transporter substrate-binding protein [Ectorhizobium quercum]MCX8997171.1 amino acid ABC transporter substrate-binding protein [Ectorhizobium quercum]